MFLFFHKDQSENNIKYFKGKLFEELLQNLLKELGYDVKIRQKKNSLEYDIEGCNMITSEKLIAEAKAHGVTIPGKDIAAFMGKLVPLGIMEKKVCGLFISVSAFTPEAEDYFRTLHFVNLKKYCGDDLHSLICKKMKLPETEILLKSIPNNYSFVTGYILTTDSGYFKLLICRSAGSGTPNCFIVFDDKGSIVTDMVFLVKIKGAISELQDLEPIKNKCQKLEPQGRIIELGLQLSTDWTDYKLPASPKYFVGRATIISAVDREIANNTSTLVQIKSRSGVGKSSLLAFLEDKYKKQNHVVDLHDSRDIKSTLDIFLLVQRFTRSNQIAKDFREVHDQINCFVKTLKKKSLFFVDQFESTFNRKDIFDAYENLFSLLTRYSDKIVVILARKNDQLTTFDETEISLERINAQSTSITLKDFDKDEAIQLIKKIVKACGSNIDKEVLAYVIEFSQGFPWLIKRTMAHILKQLNTGTSQSDLIADGLKLDDLFNEELEGLDEVQLDYLTRIIQVLPANYNQLHKVFDEDPLLTKMLDILTKTRLIRLSGSTYDTYNDVLKEYILYKKLPQFKQKNLHRISAYAVIRNFIKIQEYKILDIDLIQNKSNTTKGTVFNIIREWKILNLIESTETGWKIPQIVLDVIKQGRLGDYLRRELAKNDAVSSILNSLSQGSKVTTDMIPELLVKEFPFVDASEDTWSIYAKALLSWMQILMLIDIEKDSGELRIPSKSRIEIVNELGNLTNIKTGGRRGKLNFFMPNHRFSLVLTFLKSHGKKEKIITNDLSANEKKGYFDLKSGGWIEEGQLLVSDEAEFIEDAKIHLQETFKSFWSTANGNGELIEEIKKIIPSLSTETSTMYYVKVLLSWGKGLGIIEDRRYKYSHKKQKKKTERKNSYNKKKHIKKIANRGRSLMKKHKK